jgi:hypothetical protein
MTISTPKAAAEWLDKRCTELNLGVSVKWSHNDSVVRNFAYSQRNWRELQELLGYVEIEIGGHRYRHEFSERFEPPPGLNKEQLSQFFKEVFTRMFRDFIYSAVMS